MSDDGRAAASPGPRVQVGRPARTTVGPDARGRPLARDQEPHLVTTVLYPGSFDPIHNGHLGIIEVASRLFDDVVVATVRNPQKGEPLFKLEDRQAMIAESVAHLDNVKITMFSSLVVDLARDVGADFIVKGLRVVSDFEAELIMAQMN